MMETTKKLGFCIHVFDEDMYGPKELRWEKCTRAEYEKRYRNNDMDKDSCLMEYVQFVTPSKREYSVYIIETEYEDHFVKTLHDKELAILYAKWVHKELCGAIDNHRLDYSKLNLITGGDKNALESMDVDFDENHSFVVVVSHSDIVFSMALSST